MKLTIVIPMFNENKIVAETINALFTLREYWPDLELIFADDGSSDHCGDTVRLIAEESEIVRVVANPQNMGKGAAIRRGVLASTGDIVVYTDCDLAYGMKQIREIIQAHLKGESVITIGSRALYSGGGYSGYTFIRKLASKAYSTLIRFLTKCKYKDYQTGLKVLNGDAARSIFSKCIIDRFAFDLEVLLIAEKLGFAITEFPVCIVRSDEELGRKSSIHLFKDTARMLRDIVRIKRNLKRLSL